MWIWQRLFSRRCLSLTQRLHSTSTSSSRNHFHNYDEGVNTYRLHKPERYNFVRDTFDVWAKKKPQNLALWLADADSKETKFTYAQLSDLAKRAANALVSGAGFKRGDRVIVVLPRVVEWWILNLACIRAGLVLCPGTSLLTHVDIKKRIDASGAKGIILHHSKAEEMEEIAKALPEDLVKISLGGSVPCDWLRWEKLVDQSSGDHKCVDNHSDEEMTLFFTSGTTGAPKMASHSHTYALGHIITGRYWQDLTEHDVMWGISDTGWAKAAYANLFGPWNQGATVLIHDQPFEPLHTLKVLRDYPVTTFCTVPTAYRLLIQENIQSYKFKALDHALSAGEPLNAEVVDVWQKATNRPIREGYGQSETVLVCGSFRCLENRPGSMGKPAPCQHVQILNDNDMGTKPYEEGDIAIRRDSIGLFSGYVDDEERTKNAIRGEYYITGDRAYKDEDGYFWFVGRSDDVIISAGYRIGPFEVESVLLEHPAVVESAVVSSPDPIRGEVVKAFVVLTEGFINCDKDILTAELQNYVKSATAPYKYPRKIEFVESLPKTVSGKTQRVELRRKEWSVK